MKRLILIITPCITVIVGCIFCDTQCMALENVSRKHAQQKSILQKIDSNNDGVIDHAEFVTIRDKCFKAMDTNCDGYLSACEFNAGAEKAFNSLDANKDGSIDSDEVTSLVMQGSQ